MNEQDDQLLQRLDALADEAPEMPEGLHQRWKEAIEMTPQNQEPSRTPNRWTRIVSVAAAAVLLLGGTIASRDLMPRKHSEVDSTPAAAAAYSGSYKRSAVPSEPTDGSNMLMANYAMSYDAEEAADMDFAAVAEEPAPAGGAELAPAQERKLIYTYNISLSCENLDNALADITGACQAADGYISSSYESSYRNSRSATLTLRIPAEASAAFLSSTEAAGRVTSRSQDVNDVTDTYYDYTGRLASQQALMDRMKEIAGEAKKISDLLEIENQMATTQGNIDYYTGLLRRMDNQVAYSTFYLSLSEDNKDSAVSDSDLSFGERIAWAFRGSLEGFVGFVQDLVVFTIAILPFIVCIAIVVLIVRVLVKKRKARKNDR